MEAKVFTLYENKIPHFLDGAETPNRVTFYPAEEKGIRPLVIVFPGGAYSFRAEHEGLPIAGYFHGQGFHTAVVDYRVSPNRYPAELEDAQRAIRLLRYHAKELLIDPERIVVIGFSAGGHLAVSTGTLEDVLKTPDADPAYQPDEIDKVSCRPDAMISVYGALSMKKEDGCYDICARPFLGDEKAPLRNRYFSLADRVTKDTPPCFLMHNADDDCVPVRQSLDFGMKLRDHSINFEMHIFPEGHHGCGLALHNPVVRQWAPLAADWIKRNFGKDMFVKEAQA